MTKEENLSSKLKKLFLKYLIERKRRQAIYNDQKTKEQTKENKKTPFELRKIFIRNLEGKEKKEKKRST